MTSETAIKDFDAVKMMREVRDKISRDIKDMTFEEQKAYFHEHASTVRNQLRMRQENRQTENPNPAGSSPIASAAASAARK